MTDRLSRADLALCALYLLLAVAALALTQWHLVRFLLADDNGGVLGFLADGFATPAAAFLTTDLLVVGTAAIAFMVVESRRIGLRRVWIYVAVSLLVAVSVGLPLFLIHRQRALAAARAGAPPEPARS